MSAETDAGTMLRREIHAAIRRTGLESGMTVYQSIGALRVVEYDLISQMDAQKPQRPTEIPGCEDDDTRGIAE